MNLSFDEKTISGTVSTGSVKVFNTDGVTVDLKNINDASVAVEAMNKAKDDDDKDKNGGVLGLGGSAVAPVLVFAGVVAAAVILVIVHDNNRTNIVSPSR